jgi:hypothetical protein
VIGAVRLRQSLVLRGFAVSGHRKTLIDGHFTANSARLERKSLLKWHLQP